MKRRVRTNYPFTLSWPNSLLDRFFRENQRLCFVEKHGIKPFTFHLVTFAKTTLNVRLQEIEAVSQSKRRPNVFSKWVRGYNSNFSGCRLLLRSQKPSLLLEIDEGVTRGR